MKCPLVPSRDQRPMMRFPASVVYALQSATTLSLLITSSLSFTTILAFLLHLIYSVLFFQESCWQHTALFFQGPLELNFLTPVLSESVLILTIAPTSNCMCYCLDLEPSWVSSIHTVLAPVTCLLGYLVILMFSISFLGKPALLQLGYSLILSSIICIMPRKGSEMERRTKPQGRDWKAKQVAVLSSTNGDHQP